MPVMEEKGGSEREVREARHDELLRELLASQKAMGEKLKTIEAEVFRGREARALGS